MLHKQLSITHNENSAPINGIRYSLLFVIRSLLFVTSFLKTRLNIRGN